MSGAAGTPTVHGGEEVNQTATGDRPASHHYRQKDPPQWYAATGRWGGVPRPRLAWWLCASALLLALSRHARFPPSMDSWEEQALVILEFLGAPILGGLIAARRPANI